MYARKGLAAFAALIAAVAVAVPVASASTATTPATPPQLASWATCPPWYGVVNLATGCAPYWVFAYGYLTQLYDTLGFPFHVPPLP
jgi:hypothetical protein